MNVYAIFVDNTYHKTLLAVAATIDDAKEWVTRYGDEILDYTYELENFPEDLEWAPHYLDPATVMVSLEAGVNLTIEKKELVVY